MVAACLCVLYGFGFFATYGRFSFRSRAWDLPGGRPADAYYNSLGEGFLRGQLSMAHRPSAALMALPNPYDYHAREEAGAGYLWDASYLNGRYYLYFSPLPALLFNIPFRLLYGAWPSDQFAAAVFASWAFLMAALFVTRVPDGRRSLPAAVWILLLGFGGIVPFVMVYARTYEVAILCGMALTSTWAWSLVRFIETPDLRRLLWISTWLGLAIAARPNLAVLLVVTFLALPKPRLRPSLIAMIPLTLVAGSLLAYNYLRFHDPFEFGHRYQLTYMSMAEKRVCGCLTLPEARRLVHHASLYVFAPPALTSSFPFVELPERRLDGSVAFADRSEEVGGLAPLMPVAMLGSLLALAQAIRREEGDPGMKAAALVTAGGWLILFGVASCWFVTARYQADFMLLISTGAISIFDRRAISSWLRLTAVLLVLYSVVLGVLLGLKGSDGAFARENPELFQRLAVSFSRHGAPQTSPRSRVRPARKHSRS